MEHSKIYTLDSNYISMINEICSISAAKAITSVSSLINRRINMDRATMNIRSAEEMSSIFGDESKYIAAMLTEVVGDLNGALVLAFNQESTKRFIKLVLDRDVEDICNLDEMEYSLLCETGNILGGSYLTNLTTLTKLNVNQSVPQMSVDLAGSISQFTAINFLAYGEDSAVLLEAEFSDEESLLCGTYVLVMDTDSFDKLVDSLNEITWVL